MTSEPAAGKLARRPGFLLSRAGAAVQDGFKQVLEGWGLRPLHFLILTTVQASEKPSQQDLCRALGIDSGNMVELIDLLGQRGYTERARDPTDRRRYVVTITAEGRKALGQIMKAIEDYDRQFFAPLSATEQGELASLLAKLYAPTSEARGGGFVGAPGSTDAGSRDASRS